MESTAHLQSKRKGSYLAHRRSIDTACAAACTLLVAVWAAACARSASAQVACQPSPLLQCSTQLDGTRYVLHWTLNDTKLEVASVAETTGFVGLGFSKDGGMVGSQAVIGWVDDSTGTLDINMYNLNGQVPSQVVPNNGIRLSSKSGSQNSTTTTVRWQLDVNSALPEFLQLTATTQLIWSYSSSNFDGLAYHGTTRGATQVDFSTGQAQNVPSSSPFSKKAAQLAHGIINFIAFGVLLPLGVLVARNLRYKDPVWFHMHYSIQITGVILATVAFIIAMAKLLPYGTWHGKLGTAVYALAVTNVLLALFRPPVHHKYRQLWSWPHRLIGISVIIMAAVTIFKGINRYAFLQGYSPKAVNIAFGVYVGVLAAVALALEFWRMRYHGKDQPKHESVESGQGTGPARTVSLDASIKGRTVEQPLNTSPLSDKGSRKPDGIIAVVAANGADL
eukprot:jgi/Chlat1/8830/Chrsp91S09256